MVHHGGVTDALFRQGRSRVVRDFVDAVHDLGLLAGVSAHNPDCIRRIADEDWPVDFFMTCFHNMTREGPPVGAPADVWEPRRSGPFTRPTRPPCAP